MTAKDDLDALVTIVWFDAAHCGCRREGREPRTGCTEFAFCEQDDREREVALTEWFDTTWRK